MEQYNSIKIQYLHELEIIIEFETPFEGNLNYDKYLCSYFYKWGANYISPGIFTREYDLSLKEFQHLIMEDMEEWNHQEA